MQITSQMVKELRDKTNAGMMDCKKALAETGGESEKAIDLLRQKGLAVARKRANRTTSEGMIETYIHADGKIGVMVEVGCETDFVAKNSEFRIFAKNVAIHIAAANPIAIKPEEVPKDVLERERNIFRQQGLDSGKPANIVEKMLDGKTAKFYAEVCLMGQKYVKNPDLSVQDLLNELIAKLGENISVKRFARFQIGA
ncbi:MAG: translation elongation factor Ts [Desulfobulbaceae bacterium]|nr:MAG: translation elongation factor Ts [Desulfobulbaceae bacterium]